MCSVSFVSDYYLDPLRKINNTPIKEVVMADEETKALLRKAIEILERIDKKIGDVECHDEAKNEFLESLGMKKAKTKKK